MTSVEVKRFDVFLMESLGEGVSFRELRLSLEEKEYLLSKYPDASLKEIPTREYCDGKVWYEVKL